MTTTIIITFFIVSVGIIIIPGPNVLIIISTSLKYGKRRGLQTVAGTSLAMLIQLVIAAMATSWFVELLSEGFYIFQYIGVVYCLFVGVQYIKTALLGQHENIPVTTSATFSRGFLVSLMNPKTIIFFSAFLPQFVSSTASYLQQISLLSASFLIIAIFFDCCYALLAAKLRTLLEIRQLNRTQNGLSGLLFIGTAAWLATLRRIA